MFLVKNLDRQNFLLARVAVYTLVFAGVCLIVLVRWVMLKAGASANAALVIVLVVALLYSVLVNIVLVKKARASIRRINTGSTREKAAGSTRKEKLRILVRLIFQASLFFLGSWLLVGGSPDMGQLGKMPLTVRLLIVAAAASLLIWRVIRARRLLIQLDQQAHEVA